MLHPGAFLALNGEKVSSTCPEGDGWEARPI